MILPDKIFAGSIPEFYEAFMVPVFFAPYADDLVTALASRSPACVLELAAGTGVVTRRMAERLPDQVAIVATDLNQPMLDHAAAIGTARPVEWRQADALDLPFPDQSFDAVVCQFGVMFFPDRSKAFAEARRVLRPGGVFLFNAWDRIEENAIDDAVTNALAALFPEDPPRFMARTPHGYHDRAAIARDLVSGGFSIAPEIDTVSHRSVAPSARHAALALCQGTPLRSEIEARAPSRLEKITDRVADALVERFGRGPVDGKMQAHIVLVAR